MPLDPDDDRHARGEDIPTEGEQVEIPETPADKALREHFARVARLQADHVAGKREALALIAELKLALGALSEPPQLHWHTLRKLGAAEWFAMAPPRRRWLLELPGLDDEGNKKIGVVPLGKVGMLAAAGAAGKTMALVQLALAVATGREWLDIYTTPNPGYVLLALGEEDAEEVQRRLYAAGKLMRLTDEQVQLALDRIVVQPLAGRRVALIDEHGNDSDTFRWIKHHLQTSGHDWRLIAFDPLSRFAGADTEKDNAAATAFIEAMESLAEMPGKPAVILAHHITKNARSADGDAKSVNAARGAGALTDGARWVANLEPKENSRDRVELAFSKSNYGPPPGHVVLVRENGGALRAEKPAERDARIKAEQDDQKSKPSADDESKTRKAERKG